MWHIAKSKASQSHTQHNLYVTDNREIVCSQNYTSTSTFFYLPIGHRTFHRHFLSILLFHFFWILRMRPESQSNPTDHSFFFFKIFSFFFAKCNRHTNYRSLPAKASTTKLASQDKLLPEHVQILNNDEKWTAITPQG